MIQTELVTVETSPAKAKTSTTTTWESKLAHYALRLVHSFIEETAKGTADFYVTWPEPDVPTIRITNDSTSRLGPSEYPVDRINAKQYVRQHQARGSSILPNRDHIRHVMRLALSRV